MSSAGRDETPTESLINVLDRIEPPLDQSVRDFIVSQFHYRCPMCKCHFTGAPEAAKLHEDFHALKVQAALSVLSLEDRANLSGK